MSVGSQFKEEADNFFKVVNNTLTLTDDELQEVYALFKQVTTNDEGQEFIRNNFRHLLVIVILRSPACWT